MYFAISGDVVIADGSGKARDLNGWMWKCVLLYEFDVLQERVNDI